MKRHPRFEQCERRDLLAADLQAWHDPAPVVDPPMEPGDEVTRVVRVFNNGDEPALAEINSSLTAELQDPTWQRQLSRAKELQQANALVGGRAADYVLEGLGSFSGLLDIGDVNGDTKQDFLYTQDGGRDGHRIFLLPGGLATGQQLNEDSTELSVRDHAHLFSRLSSFSRLGDLDGDGYGDFAIANRIVWGAANTFQANHLLVNGDANTYLAISDSATIRGVGDLNADGHPDLVVHGEQASHLVWGGSDLRQTGSANLMEWITDPSRTLLVEGQATTAAPAGDLNADGYDDLVVARRPIAPHNSIAAVVFGGPGLAATDSVSLDQLSGDDGFHVRNLIDANVLEYCGYSETNGVQARGDGDINGDGVDDLLIGFDGSYGGAECITTRDHGGAIVLLGGSQIGGEGTVDALSDNVLGYKLTLPLETMLFPRLVDANGDQRLDIVLPATHRTYVIFGQDAIASVDFTDDSSSRHQLRGGDGVLLHERADYVDIDGNGITDLITARRSWWKRGTTLHVFMDASQPLATDVTRGSGDITDIIHMPAGTGVTYTVRGRLKEPTGDTIVSTASQVGGIPSENLLDNVAGAPPRSQLSVEMQATQPLVAGNAGSIAVTITNAGPLAADNIMISENVSALFDSMTWTRTTQMFPATVPLARAAQFGAFSVAALGYARSGTTPVPSGGPGPNKVRGVGRLGDVNGDGYQDFYIKEDDEARLVFGGQGYGVEASLSSGAGQLHLQHPSGSGWISEIVEIGDVNDDGVSDIGLGQGRQWYVLLGDVNWGNPGRVRTLQLDASNLVSLPPNVQDLRILGDINNDGRGDLGVRTDSRYFVLADDTQRLALLQQPFPDSIGFSSSQTEAVVPVGDMNADGFDDIVVTWRPPGPANYTSSLVFGSRDTPLAGSINAAVEWSLVNSLAGFVVPGEYFYSGDIDGDGMRDLVVDTESHDSGYVLYGSEALSPSTHFAPDQLDGDTGFQWRLAPAVSAGFDLNILFPRRISTVADVNGDGYDDLVSSHGDQPCRTAGPVYVNYGRPKAGGEAVRELKTDGEHGFQIAWDWQNRYSLLDQDLCIAAVDLNGDGAAELLAAELANYYAGDGAIHSFMGHPSAVVDGTGSLESKVTLPPGASVTYHIEGVLRAESLPTDSVNVTIQTGDQSPTLGKETLSDTLLLSTPSADLDGDGRVGFSDFLILSQAFSRTDATASEGDLDGDGGVDFADFLILRTRYGAG